ncbi:MAG: hypothetical protein HY897_04615 [Deltaproteobacteria bacterium]|nr:hypothetical protein [Deltaproteobacteria bacterium]
MPHDELYDEAKRLVRRTTLPSVTYVQRKLKVDFSRAARILRDLEAEGVFGVPPVDPSPQPETPASPELPPGNPTAH